MPSAPAFWQHDGWLPRLLSPLGVLTAAITARRVAQTGWRAPVPVICCGNVSVGGSGKTTLALDLGQRLLARGVAVHFLLRGYGGAARGTHRVAVGDDAALVGDEALLLAALAPTWIGGDRAASARAAVAQGAEALVLDDGLQNPTLVKDLALLVVDGGVGFGNGFVLPAGPLREPIAAGAARCQAAVLIGADRSGAAAALPAGLPVLRGRLDPGPAAMALAGRRVLAFAGIGTPGKFFATLEEVGAVLVDRVPFADHHAYSERDWRGLLDGARRLDAVAATTAKDAVRLPTEVRAQIAVADIRLAWHDPTAIETLLARYVAR